MQKGGLIIALTDRLAKKGLMKKGDDAKEEADEDVAAESAMQDFIDAVKADDSKGALSALKDCMSMCGEKEEY